MNRNEAGINCLLSILKQDYHLIALIDAISDTVKPFLFDKNIILK